MLKIVVVLPGKSITAGPVTHNEGDVLELPEGCEWWIDRGMVGMAIKQELPPTAEALAVIEAEAGAIARAEYIERQKAHRKRLLDPEKADEPSKCAGTTKAGNPCKAFAVEDSEFCKAHGEDE